MCGKTLLLVNLLLLAQGVFTWPMAAALMSSELFDTYDKTMCGKSLTMYGFDAGRFYMGRW